MSVDMAKELNWSEQVDAVQTGLASLQRRVTRADWREASRSNPVAQAMARAGRQITELAAGRRPVVYVSGPFGAGKEDVVREGLREFKTEPIFCNPSSHHDVLTGFRLSGGERPLVFRKADAIFRTPSMLALFNAATDPDRANRAHEGVRVDAPCIVTTNIPLGSPTAWPRVLQTHVGALFDAYPPVIIPDEPAGLWEYTVHLAIVRNLLDNDRHGNGIPMAIRQEALDYFTRHMWEFDAIGPRTLKNIAHTMNTLRGEDRESELKAIAALRPSGRRSPPLPVIPPFDGELVPRTKRRGGSNGNRASRLAASLPAAKPYACALPTEFESEDAPHTEMKLAVLVAAREGGAKAAAAFKAAGEAADGDPGSIEVFDGRDAAVLKTGRHKLVHYGLIERVQKLPGGDQRAYTVVRSKRSIPTDGRSLGALEAVPYRQPRNRIVKARCSEAWHSSLEQAERKFSALVHRRRMVEAAVPSR